MTDLTRRTVLGAATLGTLGLMTAQTASATSHRRTTLIVSPHPDDEVLRGAGYINFAYHRGDRLVLLALTDGGATRMGPNEGLSRRAVEERRAAEQTGAWSALTYGRGKTIRAGLPDGALTYDAARSAIRSALAAHPGAEVYVCAHPWDGPASPDHIPAWKAARDSGAAAVRYLKAPTYSGGGTGEHYPPDLRAAEDAVAAYWWTLGPRTTVADQRDALIRSGYLSRYTRP